jgi:hypothetical protein
MIIFIFQVLVLMQKVTRQITPLYYPEKYRPTKEVNVFMAWNNDDTLFRLRVYATGRLRSWNLGSIKTLPTGSAQRYWESFICYCVN